jgi:hypothetical protein
MLSVRKTWPARVLTAMMALALVLACTFAAYAHAAGHHHHHHAGHMAQGIDAHDSCAGEGPGHCPAGHELEHGDTDGAGPGGECCSILCTGALAILVAAAVIEHPLAAAPATEPEALLDGALLSGLERPPKSSDPA